ncbi:MAG: diguanylate cyclase [Magnetococcales bacterium]|nr:diguanylate cyclase [Magnetococcales bacterium]
MAESDKQALLDALLAKRRSYADTLPEKWQEIEQVWQTLKSEGWHGERFKTLHRLVHTIAGSAGTFGLPDLGKSARRAEIRLNALAGISKEAISLPIAEIDDDLNHLHLSMETARLSEPDLPLPNVTIDKQDDDAESVESNRLIYIVENNTPQGEEIAQQLQYYGYTPKRFHALGALRSALRDEEPAAVIMDITRTDERSTKAMRILQKSDETQRPILFISSDHDMESRLMAVRGGGIAYLQKPVDISKIIDILDDHLDSDHQEQARILIVEDADSLANLYSMVLSKAGMETRAVTDPMRVLDELDTFHPDLILMDLYMPGCTGFEVAAVIRQVEKLVSVPIVYLSGETDIHKQMAAMDLGGDDFLTKPIEPTHLVSSVRARLKRALMLRALMLRDGLTGLLNHSTTKDRLIQEVDRSRREKRTMAFAMLDIDHFKLVNDTYGHPTGDRVIKSLARLLKQRLRQTDIVGRFGGEEFAVILPNTSAEDARRLMDELRIAFAKVQHQHEQTLFSKTFSCGIALYPPCTGATNLNDSADGALYRSKEGGRNRVTMAEHSSE